MTDTNDLPAGAFFDEIFLLNDEGETVPVEHPRPWRAATREALADFETELYDPLRRARDAKTPFDDELPVDPLADLDATRSALDRLGRA